MKLTFFQRLSKRVEMKALVDSALECSNHNYGESINQQSKKHEAHTL